MSRSVHSFTASTFRLESEFQISSSLSVSLKFFVVTITLPVAPLPIGRPVHRLPLIYARTRPVNDGESYAGQGD